MWSQSKKHNLNPELWTERYKEKRTTGCKGILCDINQFSYWCEMHYIFFTIRN